MAGVAQKMGQKYHKSPFYCVFFLFFPLVIWAARHELPASKKSSSILTMVVQQLQLSMRQLWLMNVYVFHFVFPQRFIGTGALPRFIWHLLGALCAQKCPLYFASNSRFAVDRELYIYPEALRATPPPCLGSPSGWKISILGTPGGILVALGWILAARGAP